MASAAARVVLVIVGIVVATFGVLGIVYGPRLYREGRAVVAPIMEMAQLEKKMQQLNESFPFEAPADGLISEDRLESFLGIRRELRPLYQQWSETERSLRGKDESWEDAKEVLGVLGSVFSSQIELLRRHEMSQAEFRWLEELVYDTWLPHVRGRRAGEPLEAERALREVTTADLQALAKLELRYGHLPVIGEMRARLQERLAGLDATASPAVPEVSQATGELLWAHREEIAALDLEEYSELHAPLRNEDVRVVIGDE
jgi:hypothetical protein